jgi:AraC-like DNA-binding protein
MTETVDIVLRTAAVMSALLFSGSLVAAGHSRPAALPGALFAIAVAAFVVTSAPNVHTLLGAWAYPLTALCVTKSVWFWLFARALFREKARLQPRHFAACGAIAVAGIWQQLVFLEKYRAGIATPLETVLGFGFDVVLLAFVILAVGEAARDLAVDLVERRRRLRLAFIGMTGGYLGIALIVQSLNLLFDMNTAPSLVRANMALIALASLGAAWLLLQVRAESWLETARAETASPLNHEEQAVAARLERAFDKDRLYLEEGLTIGALAERLETREHVLRRVINRGLAYRNFNDFLHAWRIREACEELARPELARLPVLSIAMKVGYGSIGAFNRAFKARVGMTPTDFRRRQVEGTISVH